MLIWSPFLVFLNWFLSIFLDSVSRRYYYLYFHNFRIHKELRKCQGKRVRLHRFADDYGRFSENSLVGLLDLPNRAIKVSRDENSPKKKRRLENEEIQKLKKGQECFMQWPIKIGERFYDCPIKVAPDLFINLTTEKNIEGIFSCSKNIS